MLALALAMTACSTGKSMEKTAPSKSSPLRQEGSRKVSYQTHTLIFNGSTGAEVSERAYRTETSIAVRSTVQSYRLENYVNNLPKPDTVVLLAISGKTAGLSILGPAGIPLAEYSNGKVVGNTLLFEQSGETGKLRIRWMMGISGMASFVESLNPRGEILYSEITTFTPTSH